jgi:16S rRNA C1402 N4-methylase RsmH
MARDDAQINVRLSDEQNEVLEAAAWVRRASKSELAKGAVLKAIGQYRKEPEVANALKARRSADQEDTKKVTQLESRATKPKTG